MDEENTKLVATLRELLPDACLARFRKLATAGGEPAEAAGPGGEQLLRAVERACPQFGWDYLRLSPDPPFSRLAVGPGGLRVGYFFLPIFPHDVPDSELAHGFIETAYYALKRLVDSSATHLLFDLRGHPGGLLYIFMMIAGFFVDPTKPLVYPTSHGSRSIRFDNGYFFMNDSPKMIKNPLRHAGAFVGLDKKVRVLVDNKTASCGELIALALRDSLADCLIVGSPSHGALTMFAQIRVGAYVVSVPHAVLLDRATGRPLLGLTPDRPDLEPDLLFALPYN